MTKLSDKQYDMLARIGALYGRRRAVRSEVLKEIDTLIENRTNRINEELFEVVRDAVNAGVPKSRIGAAIGTSANKTWNELITAAFGVTEPEVDYGDERPPSFWVTQNMDNTRTVFLDNYLLDGDVVTGEVEFARVDDEWLVQGDDQLGSAVERALFGAEQDEALRAEFDKVVA